MCRKTWFWGLESWSLLLKDDIDAIVIPTAWHKQNKIPQIQGGVMWTSLLWPIDQYLQRDVFHTTSKAKLFQVGTRLSGKSHAHSLKTIFMLHGPRAPQSDHKLNVQDRHSHLLLKVKPMRKRFQVQYHLKPLGAGYKTSLAPIDSLWK